MMRMESLRLVDTVRSFHIVCFAFLCDGGGGDYLIFFLTLTCFQYILFSTADESKFTGEISWINLSEANYWRIDIDDITIGSISSRETNGIVDSGTSLITGPSTAIAHIAHSVGAKRGFTGQYTFHCSRVGDVPDLEFKIDGKVWTVPGEDLVIQAGDTCLFALMAMDMPHGAPKWILGDVFMRQYYTIFDYEKERVGFAEPNY
mmetsp:Transcript_22553/g.40124  ORF Transcript_22553/g.40124 Transcript_22553/m.40124 type:complete len:204 (+) Transcript_22553:920-1531(+)